ncbi:MAG: hypothetical protein HOV80_01390 [Polyangiaceae bacterium]|nr:hypothetical protein [Polyangiaceae bacterium]
MQTSPPPAPPSLLPPEPPPPELPLDPPVAALVVLSALEELELAALVVVEALSLPVPEAPPSSPQPRRLTAAARHARTAEERKKAIRRG